MDLADWQARRADAHFLGNNRGVRDYQDACRFIEERKVVVPWLTKSNPVPLPSLRKAYKQPVKREPGPVWDWKDCMPGEKRAFYGNLARKCKVLIAPDALAAFYRASGRTGDPEDYLIDYEAGQLSYLGKQVMDLLMEQNYFIKDLQEQLRRRGVDISRLSTVLDELREKFYLTHIGVVNEGRSYGFVWSPLDRHWPEMVEQAMGMSKSAARSLMLLSLLRGAVLSSPRDLQRMTGWSDTYFSATLSPLLEAGKVEQVPDTDLLALALIE